MWQTGCCVHALLSCEHAHVKPLDLCFHPLVFAFSSSSSLYLSRTTTLNFDLGIGWKLSLRDEPRSLPLAKVSDGERLERAHGPQRKTLLLCSILDAFYQDLFNVSLSLRSNIITFF